MDGMQNSRETWIRTGKFFCSYSCIAKLLSGYLLQVDEDGMYHFVLKEDEILHMPRYESYVNKTRQLTMEESVCS